jgi:hypothetical protein
VDRVARRKLIVKRVAARKISATWKLKREQGAFPEKMLDDEADEQVGTDATMDELPDLM